MWSTKQNNNEVKNLLVHCQCWHVFVYFQECGGIMTLTDVYCRVNRARGMEVWSLIDNLISSKHAPIISAYNYMYFLNDCLKIWLEVINSIYPCSFYASFAVPLNKHISLVHFQLLSPEDLLNACEMFELLRLPVRWMNVNMSINR